MADGNISLRHQEMLQAAADIRASKDSMQQFLRQASRVVEEVTGRAYRSRTASPAFKDAHAEWNGATGELVESLVQLADGVEQTKGIDEQTDQQARGRVDEIRNAGGSRRAGGGGTGIAAGGGAAAGSAAAVAGVGRAARSRGGGGGTRGGGGGGGGGGGATPAGGGGRPKRDPVYSAPRVDDVKPYAGIAQRNWQPKNPADGARYAYDETTYRGATFTRTQGMQTTVTRDMLRDVPRTSSPPRALTRYHPGYDNRYKLQMGHLWADRLGGPNAVRNFVPVHPYANGNRGMAHVESMVADAVKHHGSVELVVLPRYFGNEPIPREILYHWRVPGGQWTAMKIDNVP
jgi:uncharacterized protein YukE